MKQRHFTPIDDDPTATEGFAICVVVVLALSLVAWALVVGCVALGEYL